MITKRVFALAAFATFSTANYAQSSSGITMYGVVDLGVAYTDNGANTASNSVLLSSGISRPSLFGIQGTEDLGDGLKAQFRLEAGFDADTGAFKTYQGNPSSATPAAPGGASAAGLFNRRSYVGLTGNFGGVSLGRDYTPLYWAALDSDAMGLTFYGNLQESVALSGTGSDRFGRASNAIFYVSPEMGGFTGRAMYSLGSESAGGAGAPPSKANRMMAVSGKYKVGGFMVTGVYQQLELPTIGGTAAAPTFTGATGTRKDMSIGTRYTFGDYSVTAGYLLVKQPIANTDGSQYWIGGTAKVGTGTVLVNVQRLRQNVAVGDNKTATVFGLGYLYPLSKRTALYASYGQVSNSSTALFPLVAADAAVAPGAAGAAIKALAFGVRHSF
jgi:predicted porin